MRGADLVMLATFGTLTRAGEQACVCAVQLVAGIALTRRFGGFACGFACNRVGDDARERTAAEFQCLFERAGLRVVSVHRHCAYTTFVTAPIQQ